MTVEEPRNHIPFFRSTVILTVLLAATLTAALCLHQASQLEAMGNVIDGVPLIGNNDGYFHLGQARDIAENGHGFLSFLTETKPSMLLSHALAAVAGSDRTTLERVAGLAGPAMSLSMLLAVLPWAWATRSRFMVLAAPLLALLAPYWMTRTHLGILDTDGLAPALIMGGLFCLRQFAFADNKRWCWGAGYLFSLFLLWYWWNPGAYLAAGFLLLLIVCPPPGLKSLRYVLAGCAMAAAVAALAGIKPFADVLHFAVSHARLVFGDESHSLLNRAILELHGLSLSGLGEQSLGAAWLLVPAVIGAIAFAFRFGRSSLFLLSCGLFGIASLASERFVVLFIPAAALCCAFGLLTLCRWTAEKLSMRDSRSLLLPLLPVLCLPVLFFGVAGKALSFKPRQYFTAGDVQLVRTLRQSFPQDAAIWTWWDYGYFFQYMTGMKVLFDGGSQTNASCFVGAYPLVQDDPELAAAWMRFYTAHSPERINQLMKGEKWADYLKLLKKEALAFPPPSTPVALCLPRHVFDSNGYLVSFASFFGTDTPPVSNHLDLFSREGFAYSPQDNVVDVPEAIVSKGYAGFGAVLDATGRTPQDYDFDAFADPYLVFSDKVPFLAVTDRQLVGSVLFRLLGLFDGMKPFETISFDYESGGVWRVK